MPYDPSSGAVDVICSDAVSLGNTPVSGALVMTAQRSRRHPPGHEISARILSVLVHPQSRFVLYRHAGRWLFR